MIGVTPKNRIIYRAILSGFAEASRMGSSIGVHHHRFSIVVGEGASSHGLIDQTSYLVPVIRRQIKPI